jgi:methyl-accepting chemotaxis protein
MVKNNLKENAKEVAYHIADASHHELITSINEYYNALNEMATIFAILNSKYNDNTSIATVLDILENGFKNHGIEGGTVYLLDGVIEPDAKENEYYLFNDSSEKYALENLENTRTAAPWHKSVMFDKAPYITEPFFYNNAIFDYVESATQQQLDSGEITFMFTMAVPIFGTDGSAIGAVTMDIHMNSFQRIVEQIKPFGTGYAILLSREGAVMVAPDAAILGTDYSKIEYMKGFNPADIISAYSSGKDFATEWYNAKTGKDMGLVTFALDVGELKPLGLIAAFTIDDAYKSVKLPAMLLISRSILAFIVIIIIIIYLITKHSIINYLKQFMSALKDLTEGDGDLTKQILIKTGDEFEVLAGYLNMFVSSLKKIIHEVKIASDEMASGNNQLAISMEELSATFSGQSKQVSTIAKNINVINDSSKATMSKLEENNEKMNGAQNSMLKGSKQLDVVVNDMNLIKEKNRSLSVTVENLSESSSRIGDILGVINDIADQTNLLALNAAIEAARAGDAGRGFAVVADEVRKLAERTQRSTSEISAIIMTLQKETSVASSGMNDATVSVNGGLENINKTNEVFKNVVDVVNEIGITTKDVNNGISDQSKMIQDVDDNTNGIAAGVEESVQAAQEILNTVSNLQSKAETLKRIVSKFKVD